ncbi:MAG: response regulator [Bryobacteraceae bacterium]
MSDFSVPDQAFKSMDNLSVSECRILIVDDHAPNVDLIETILHGAGYRNVKGTTDARQAVPQFKQFEPDLIIVDLMMPHVDGYTLLGQFATMAAPDSYLPILVLTADLTREAKQRALVLGAKDFLTKPFDASELLLRAHNLLQTRMLYLQIQGQNRELDQRVRARTREVAESQIEVLHRLAIAAEYRDDTTGWHTRRVGHTSVLLARSLGVSESEIELIELTAPLHDIGKIGIPDQILLKNRRLTRKEFEIVKSHVIIGGKILSRGRSPVLKMAESIALYHHERWDGSGYCAGLAGERIPLPARIVAVADAFDALTHERPYKNAWPTAEALAEIRRQQNRRYDPKIVAALEKLVSADQLTIDESGDQDVTTEKLPPRPVHEGARLLDWLRL